MCVCVSFESLEENGQILPADVNYNDDKFVAVGIVSRRRTVDNKYFTVVFLLRSSINNFVR